VKESIMILYVFAADVMHCFELRTANVDYYVGEDPLYGQKDATRITLPPADSGVGAHLAKSWETSIRQALMPVTLHPSKYFRSM
jgi:protein kinase D